MSNYSQLYVGRLYFSWKNDIPTFLTFLFDKDGYYCQHDPEDNTILEALGYLSTRERSLAALERFGFSLDFCVRVYEFFYDDLLHALKTHVEHRLGEIDGGAADRDRVDAMFSVYFSSFPSISRLEEIKDFARMLSSYIHTDFEHPPFDRPITSRWLKEPFPAKAWFNADSRDRDSLSLDFERLGHYALDNYDVFAPWLLMLCDLFDYWGYIRDYPEVVSIALIRLALEAVEPNSEVRLELSDIIEEEQDAKDMHSELITSLVEKIRLYNTVFGSIVEHQEDVRDKYYKAECTALLREIPQAATNFDRGRMLERMSEMLFSPGTGLSVISRNVKTGDEEIDLLIKNNVDRPFWMSFGSPLIFIECKNLKTPIGASEMRNFEMKMRNHGRLARLGYFISLGGFTSEVHNELRRAGRDDYHIVLLDRTDIEAYLSSSTGLLDWLESKMVRLH